MIMKYPETQSDIRLEKYGYNFLKEYAGIINLAKLEKRKPVLDIATGSGRMAFILLKLGHEVISIDNDSEVIKQTKKRFKEVLLNKMTFMTMDASQLMFRDDSFATVVSANTLHETRKPIKILSEMKRICKKNGKLLVIDFNELGFEIMDKIHKKLYNKTHTRGKISAETISEWLRVNFVKTRVCKMPLNNVWIANKKL
jgi:ubiquinone/menaquinone biosynthesis C-methylase UbiE